MVVLGTKASILANKSSPLHISTYNKAKETTI